MQRRARLGLIGAVILAALQGSATPSTPTGFVSAFSWAMDDDLFGGFSGIELSPDGRRFVALTDRGAYTQGTITRDETGKIIKVEAAPLALLRARGEAPIDPERAVSEGLAWAADGTIYVSFEGVARVLRYSEITGPAKNLPTPREFDRLQENSSLEALAIDDEGRLYTLPERSGREDRPFPVWRFDGKWGQPFTLPREGDFLPVGADFGPDGRLYLLERNFLGLGGFASRVRAFIIGSQGVDAGEVVLETAPGLHDNLEGLSVWQDQRGAIRLTMVSDDNFQFYLRTEIVEYALPR